MSHSDYFAHETAVIDDGALIGAGTKIWHFSHIMTDAVVGERCNIGQNVVTT
jgi:UDP-2-acetamido-3-amino-2,3-dideoxy-glucuronate N-acetyltransferase